VTYIGSCDDFSLVLRNTDTLLIAHSLWVSKSTAVVKKLWKQTKQYKITTFEAHLLCVIRCEHIRGWIGPVCWVILIQSLSDSFLFSDGRFWTISLRGETQCHISAVHKPCDKGNKQKLLAGMIHQYTILCDPLL